MLGGSKSTNDSYWLENNWIALPTNTKEVSHLAVSNFLIFAPPIQSIDWKFLPSLRRRVQVYCSRSRFTTYFVYERIYDQSRKLRICTTEKSDKLILYRVTGMNISMSSGTFLIIRKAHSAAFFLQPKYVQTGVFEKYLVLFILFIYYFIENIIDLTSQNYSFFRREVVGHKLSQGSIWVISLPKF